MNRNLVLMLLLFPLVADAQVARMDYPMEVSGDATLDASTHFYEYAYSIANPPANPANTSHLVVKVQPGVDVITDIRSPSGWTALYSEEKGMISWAATEVVVPPDYVDDGNVLEGRATIHPGQQLSGFSFKSFSPPGQGTAITQTFSPLPVYADEEQAELSGGSQLPDDNGYRVATTVPQPDLDYLGNRRPTVDGFLVFANLDENATYSGSAALIVIRLAAGGETVYPETLQISLNQRDVTPLFVWNTSYKGYAAELTSQNSGLAAGKNVLITAVDGIVPDSGGHVTKDVDRVTFGYSP